MVCEPTYNSSESGERPPRGTWHAETAVMSSDVADNTSIRTSPPWREIRVVNWPLRDDPWRTLAAAACCVAAGGLAGLGAASWSMGAVAAAALGLTLWKLWIPLACELGPAGVTLGIWRWRRHVAWRQIDQVHCVSRGVFLCGAGAAGWTRGWRSLYLPWRRQANLVAEFHEFYGRGTREPVRLPDTSLR